MTNKDWEIKERLSNLQLQTNLEELNDEYAGRLVRHVKTQGCYRITHFSALSKDSKAEYSVNYHPFDEYLKRDYDKVKHTRPVEEFFDGRFTI